MSTFDETKSPAHRLRKSLLDLSRHQKRAILAAADFTALGLVLWGVISFRYNELYIPTAWSTTLLLLAAPVLTVSTMAHMGLYRFVTRYLGSRGHGRIIAGVAASVLIWALLVFMSGQLGIPRSVVISYGVIGSIVIIVSRYIVGWMLKTSGVVLPVFDAKEERYPVIIYGAGQMGLDLASALYRARSREVVGFCDNSPSLWGQYVGGFKVYRPERLGSTIERFGVKEVLLAIPAQDRNERRLVLKELENYPVTVKIMPSLDEIASGRVSVTDLRPLEVEDLLGRDSVPPNIELLARHTKGKNVLVTGAGGSVGSELVRQVLRQSPKRLVLLDISEAALYEISMEITDLVAARKGDGGKVEITSVLGSVLDAALVSETLAPRRDRDNLSCCRLQARSDRRAERGGRPIKQHFRHRNSGGCRHILRRRAHGFNFDRQSRASDKRHGRVQALGRTRAPGACLGEPIDRFHDGALRQRAR